jgi:hypothetical protein
MKSINIFLIFLLYTTNLQAAGNKNNNELLFYIPTGMVCGMVTAIPMYFFHNRANNNKSLTKKERIRRLKALSIGIAMGAVAGSFPYLHAIINNFMQKKAQQKPTDTKMESKKRDFVKAFNNLPQEITNVEIFQKHILDTLIPPARGTWKDLEGLLQQIKNTKENVKQLQLKTPDDFIQKLNEKKDAILTFMQTQNEKNTPDLQDAIRADNLAGVAQLLTKEFANPNAPDMEESPLKMAIAQSNIDIVKLLLENGAIIGLSEKRGAIFSLDESMVDLLLKHGAKITSLDVSIAKGYKSTAIAINKAKARAMYQKLKKLCPPDKKAPTAALTRPSI